MSKQTKKCKLVRNWMTVFHYICMFLPLMIFVPISIAAPEVEASGKVVLTLGGITCIILFLISLLNDARHKLNLHKSIIWIILLVMNYTLTSVTTFLYVMCTLSLLDELIFSPIREKYTRLVEINKQIDLRS